MQGQSPAYSSKVRRVRLTRRAVRKMELAGTAGVSVASPKSAAALAAECNADNGMAPIRRKFTLAAQWLKKHPIVQRLGQFLPLAIMTLLLLHSGTSAAQEHAAGPWPELLAVALVALLQWRTGNALLSIVVGTGVYVLMRNLNHV